MLLSVPERACSTLLRISGPRKTRNSLHMGGLPDGDMWGCFRKVYRRGDLLSRCCAKVKAGAPDISRLAGWERREASVQIRRNRAGSGSFSGPEGGPRRKL